MQLTGRTLYWSIAGTSLGMGFVGFGLGLLPTLLGLGMAICGVWRYGPHGLWMVITTAGAIPALVLLHSYLTVDRTHVVLGPHDLAVVVVFGLLTIAGFIWGRLDRRIT
ncbi:MAG: hypothetical protein NZ481_09680 [Candidatus Kapabacteria bacterium]|nr:hypothetical protein [Candidatus Kapabacteria bacterium]